MADPPPSNFSKREIIDAGRVIPLSLPLDQTVIDAYRAAHSWRSSCFHPMRRVREELTGAVKRVSSSPAVTAARLKRMQSIRRKLRRTNYTLYQMQDIAGCRAILDSRVDVEALLGFYRQGLSQREIVREYDYISNPKPDGYRSHHIVLKFNGDGDDGRFHRHFVEIQIRSKLQHAWATAVEAVGLFENEDMKAGEGSQSWQRLFQLVSSEFALAEGCPIVPGTSQNSGERRKELLDLVGELDALKSLDGIREAISFSDAVRAPDAKYYLVQYDYERRKVEIVPHAYLPKGLTDYQEEEKKSALNSVFVEVDRIGDLKGAFPNYFLDVGLFAEKLREIVAGIGRGNVPSVSGWRPNLSWLADWRNRR